MSWIQRVSSPHVPEPVSTLVEVKGLAAPEILVEIEAVAHIGASRA